jgi:undecaprenyl diphosphate synthase
MENSGFNMPNHIAIIPDANRRWAKERGLDPWKGHEAGALNLERLVRYALKNGIKCLSFWGSSMDNLTKRPLMEKKALLSIYEKYFNRLLENEEIDREEVRINVIGHWEEQFPDSLKKVIRKVIGKTENYGKRFLNFMLAYSGTDDMLEAIKKICAEGRKPAEINELLLKQHLMTAGLPPVDYMIRTGGEPHLSAGFLMWDVADAQLFFSEEKFPDFDEQKFAEALEDYSSRQRRFGK